MDFSSAESDNFPICDDGFIHVLDPGRIYTLTISD